MQFFNLMLYYTNNIKCTLPEALFIFPGTFLNDFQFEMQLLDEVC